MSDEVTRNAAEIRADRNVDREQYDWMARDRDEWQKRAEMAERALRIDASTVLRLTEEVHQLKDAVNKWIAECNRISAERDAAEREWTELRAKVLQLRREYDAERAEVEATREERDAARGERDAALADKHCLRLELERMRAETEGLRADLLAHPPEPHQDLAIERKRHLELMEDYDRQNVMVGILEEAVKRAENALATAQAKHIDDRLKGFLAVISQLADQAQDLLP